LRVVVAAVLAVAADAVLVAQHLLTLGAHIIASLARLNVHHLARRSMTKQPEGGGYAGRNGRGRAEKQKKLRVAVWHGKQEIP
jgi:hypothetical protein